MKVRARLAEIVHLSAYQRGKAVGDGVVGRTNFVVYNADSPDKPDFASTPQHVEWVRKYWGLEEKVARIYVTENIHPKTGQLDKFKLAKELNHVFGKPRRPQPAAQPAVEQPKPQPIAEQTQPEFKPTEVKNLEGALKQTEVEPGIYSRDEAGNVGKNKLPANDGEIESYVPDDSAEGGDAGTSEPVQLRRGLLAKVAICGAAVLTIGYAAYVGAKIIHEAIVNNAIAKQTNDLNGKMQETADGAELRANEYTDALRQDAANGFGKITERITKGNVALETLTKDIEDIKNILENKSGPLTFVPSKQPAPSKEPAPSGKPTPSTTTPPSDTSPLGPSSNPAPLPGQIESAKGLVSLLGEDARRYAGRAGSTTADLYFEKATNALNNNNFSPEQKEIAVRVYSNLWQAEKKILEGEHAGREKKELNK
jgi:hypothetical protein